VTFYKNKYRIESSRLKNWDYSSVGYYFITICTKNRQCWFGNIFAATAVETQCIASLQPPPHHPQMELSNIGKIVQNEWLKTFNMRPDMNLIMDEFIIMPNHFHAIIHIGENQYNTQHRDAMHCVSTNTKKNKFGSQSKNLASIVRGFKIGVTQNARKTYPNFAWQPRFHDRVIRNENELNRIREYILNNPQKWADDDYYILEASQ